MYDLSSNLDWKLPLSTSESPKLALGLLIPSLILYFLAILYIFGANVHSGCVLRLTKFFALYGESPVVYSIFTKLHVP
jgi:hypothetical protein